VTQLERDIECWKDVTEQYKQQVNPLTDALKQIERFPVLESNDDIRCIKRIASGAIQEFPKGGADKMSNPIVIDMGKVEDWPISHLRRACQKNKVPGYTKMNKDELAQAVREILKNMKGVTKR
jgi:hypothetical protein